jgi:hypothetical protein
MFEQPSGKAEKDRSRTIMLLSGLAILCVIVLIVAVTSLARRPTQTEFAQAGSPEFDSYATNVVIKNIETFTGERITGKYARIVCTVENAGDKVLIGLQLRATVIGTGGQLIRDKIIAPVPKTRDTIDPNQTMRVEASLEGVPDPTEIREIKIELNGLKLK